MQPLSLSTVIGFAIMAFLLICSALVSGAEVAYFSISPTEKLELSEDKNKRAKLVLSLLSAPKKLLATILITNNFVNVAIVILSSFITNQLFNFESDPIIGFTFQIIVVTFMILLIGEVIPKVYATANSIKLARFMSYPLLVLGKLLSPFSRLLIYSTSIIEQRFKKKSDNISVDDLSTALELTSTEEVDHDQHKMLRGIVKFGAIDVKQIMKPRTDVKALDIAYTYEEVREKSTEWAHSRIPIYKDSFDKIEGILYLKDLLPHLSKKDKFNWQGLVRSPLFVPESKKIDDLLKEFQSQKMHMAIVVDEYGGTSGIVTLEDIIEEIVGDITDEFDDDDMTYSKLDDNNYIFEGKTALNDMYRVLDIDGEGFENAKGESDSIAGFVVEQAGKILKINDTLQFENFTFTIESADKRRVKRVKITIEPIVEEETEESK